eukprot:1180856-Prorocentrum_minimum.AAC.5
MNQQHKPKLTRHSSPWRRRLRGKSVIDDVPMLKLRPCPNLRMHLSRVHESVSGVSVQLTIKQQLIPVP